MLDGKLLTQAEFWERNGLSKTKAYYLDVIGRGPKWICIGSKKMLTPTAEAEWRQAMQIEPVKGDLRKLAEAKKAADASSDKEAA